MKLLLLFFPYYVVRVWASVLTLEEDITNKWLTTSIPGRSFFMGFDPPEDQARWRRAQNNAKDGSQILLKQVWQVIKSPGELLSGDINFRWLHRLADALLSQTSGFEGMKKYTGDRVPIAMFGHMVFASSEFDDARIGMKSFDAAKLIKMISENYTSIPREIVAIGTMNENWGWFSTCLTNRTTSWTLGIHPNKPNWAVEDRTQKSLQSILDHPKILAVFVNQHNNVSHPKVISIPRGFLYKSAKALWDEANKVKIGDHRKKHLLYSISSDWGPRPYITDCVQRNMKGEMWISSAVATTKKGRMTLADYTRRLSESYAVLSLPGLGYDCFRVWESIAAGSMPVLERSTGLDRSLYKLPALLLDDFAYATPEVIRQAYVEALYRAEGNEWEFERLTHKWWETLILETSNTGNISGLMKKHPLPRFLGENNRVPFSRPLRHFNCEDMGGCGPGTHRTPRKSCAIDMHRNWSRNDYNWFWEMNRAWPGLPKNVIKAFDEEKAARKKLKDRATKPFDAHREVSTHASDKSNNAVEVKQQANPGLIESANPLLTSDHTPSLGEVRVSEEEEEKELDLTEASSDTSEILRRPGRRRRRKKGSRLRQRRRGDRDTASASFALNEGVRYEEAGNSERSTNEDSTTGLFLRKNKSKMRNRQRRNPSEINEPSD